jgi:DnaJ like chaperone protein
MMWNGTLLFGALGYMIGGPFTGLLAAGMGRTVDREVEGYTRAFRRQRSDAWRSHLDKVLFRTEFLLAGHLALKAQLSPSAAEASFDALAGRRVITGPERIRAQALFEEGQREDFPLTPFVNQVRREVHRRQDLVESLFVSLVYFYSFDHAPTPALRSTLADIAARFALDEHDFAMLERTVNEHRRQASSARTASLDLTTAYATLEVHEGATEGEVRRAYRTQMSRHHPDKLMHTRPSAEELQQSARRSDRIRKSFEAIKRSRGW